ncbi:GntR family transcriptional regulator [Actinomadura sp. WMMB 499]|uniref:GntR family transcriptional regulator n=1 Tax=Actinomadura sp. WMMB 499 TaxID=1219491 RepID=UPI001246A917|nr:GntR family transcriptional regulator [Actinomadura sp. WMMB 499]QFG26516.1 GntR family transcriptional regulator [Actinomadura sp. WMMB 499]
MTAWGAYREIASALRERVVDGTYRAGTPLPGEHELSREFGVARNTLRRALDVLQDEGLIVVVTGVGRFVRPVSSQRARPMYERVAADLRAQIESGALPDGTALPSEARICERYGVARYTARRALAELEAAGLVECVRGKGRYVRRDVPR